MTLHTSINLIPSVLRLFVDPSSTTQEALSADNYDPVVTISGHIAWGRIPYGLEYDEPKDFQSPRPWRAWPSAIVSDDESKFNTLAEEWKRNTSHFSFMRQRITDPAFLKILMMREKAVPMIIRAMQNDPRDWFLALRLITETNPVPVNASVEEAVAAWTKWWRDRQLHYA